MVFDIRKIRESDVEGFKVALSSVVIERKYLLTLDLPVSEDVAKFIDSNIANDYAQYVATIDGEVVGWADIVPYQKEALRHAGVLGIGVIAEHRGKGIGKELLKQVMEHSWKNGLKRLELEVFSSNLDAIALYKKFGFEYEGTKVNGRLIDGEYRDVDIMARCQLQGKENTV